MKKIASILKNKEIMNRILFTVLILFIFRIGAQITVPGVKTDGLNDYLNSGSALSLTIQHKTSGFYYLIEFKADPQFVATLETQYHRDERILRYLTVALDQHAVAYAEHRRQTRAAKAAAATAPQPEEAPKAEAEEIETEE